ncbi:uncharacterized protein RAG0_02326 [Rhynchosporium agropyri]|uniref:Nitrogen regulatory protein areA GATA-like domain-containing protein n=1 Tax=Rhynchosporium agropyri TaxID=914238 RepID=A0A1E1K148_9HELO|nr:uncharacterized protein RAG0_02326 [Rhynchosporium agropyri]
MALILPKGIVVNSDQVNESIERIASDPLDQAHIAEFWKVYTTTKRRLLDPTAERLENHWWRIWYSDRKYLNGATIARIFDHISNGPTFVPLRGPPNRIESEPTLSNRGVHRGPAAASTSALRQNVTSTNSGTTTTTSSSISKAPAPMPHPILKKTRGPSTSGLRPTARFISPHESEHEDYQDSSVSPNSHVVVQPPSPDARDGKSDRKATSTARRKTGFSASTKATKKKRPVIVRRQSSQNSQSSADTATREAEPAHVASAGPTSLDVPPARVVSRFQENFTPSPEKSTSSHMPKKKRTPDSKRSSSRKSPNGKGRATSSKAEASVSNGDPGPSSQLRRVENLQEEEEMEELTPEELGELELQRIMLAEANARFHRKKALEGSSEAGERQTSSEMPRSKSLGTLETSGVDAMRLVQHDPKGTPSLASTLTDATGQLAFGEVGTGVPRSPSNYVPLTREQKGKGRAVKEETIPVDVFAKRQILPSQPALMEDNLSRSKSQLTLLLKKDKEKSTRNEKEGKRKPFYCGGVFGIEKHQYGGHLRSTTLYTGVAFVEPMEKAIMKEVGAHSAAELQLTFPECGRKPIKRKMMWVQSMASIGAKNPVLLQEGYEAE